MQALQVIDTKKTMAILGWLMLTGLGTLQMQPVLGGALVDHWEISLQHMGIVFGIELIAMAFGSCVAAMMARHWNRRIVCQSGLILVAVGGLLSTIHSGDQLAAFEVLCLSRGIAGFGGGLVQGVVYATSALRKNKDKTYATINVILLLWGAVTIAVVPLLLPSIGLVGVFLGFPCMALLGLPMTRFIPVGMSDLAMHNVKPLKLTLKPLQLLMLFALLFGGHGVLWVYQERMGNAIGLPGSVTGAILGLSVLMGAVGAASAGFIGKRLNYMTTQLIGLGGSIIASLIVVYGQSSLAYAIAACAVMTLWFFGLTYLLALSAEWDVSGRLSGLANAAILIGQGLGPMAAAAIVGQGDFKAVGWLSCAIYSVCIVLALSVTSGKRHEIAELAA